eukprot:jgi/Chrzof1/11852/Cz06g12120.t1
MFTMWAHCSWAKGGRRSFAADAARTSSAPQSPSRQSTATTRGMEAVMSCIMNDETGAAGSGVLAHLASCAAAKAKHLTPEETRDIALCFAHLGYVNMAFKAAITDAVVNKIDQFEPGVLADTAWAFGKVKYYDAELLQHLLGYLKSNPERFDASGYVKILWALRRFGLSGEKAMDVICEVVQKLAAKHATKCIAEVAYAEGRLRWADPCVQGSVVEYVMNNIKEFDSSSLAKVMYGLGMTGYDDNELYRLMTSRAAELMDRMRPADVALMVGACGELDFFNIDFLTAVADVAVPRNLDKFSAQELEILVLGFHMLNFSSRNVARATLRLAELLPSVTPAFPETDPLPPDMQQQTAK